MNNKIALIDIDGCLVKYPDHFIDWVEKTYHLKFMDIKEAKNRLGLKTYEKIKNNYRKSGIKRLLPIEPGAKETLDKLSRDKYLIWILTTRPKIHPVFEDTIFWLEKKGIPYTKLLFVKNKINFINKHLEKKLSILIDDDYKVIEFLSKKKKNDIKIFNFNKNIYLKNKNVNNVSSWLEIKTIY